MPDAAHMILSAEDVAADDPGLVAALSVADLPTDDLAEAGGVLLAFRGEGGAVLGYGGYERHGSHALIRSVVVAASMRGQGIGAALLPLLLRHAADAGARDAWLLTTTAAAFFARLGFRPVARGDAPQAILATRQAASLCPSSATLMHRKV